MSEIHGFKCDACGAIIVSGKRFKGMSKEQTIRNGSAEYSYRFDFCDDCLRNIMEYLKTKKGETK